MSNTQTVPPAATKRRWLWLGPAITLLAAVIVLLWETEYTADVSRTTTLPPAPSVSVLAVAPSAARAEVSAFAELRPRWDAEIRAAVAGRIIAVQNSALAGTRVVSGTPLIMIEPTPYETAVAEAELAVAQARLALLRAENQVIVARRQFARDGVDPPNELALHIPQLRIAEHGVTSSEAQLNDARRQLADTEISAPFSGFVTRRLASLGQTVSAGEPLLHLSDDSRFELAVELSQAEWELLEHPIAGGTARLYHRDGRALGTALIRQGGGYLQAETRQIRVFLEVADPGDGLLSGDFLKVVFDGREIAGSLTLPETALTRTGLVWRVDQDNLLQKVRPDILFRSGDAITIAAPDSAAQWQIAVTPLASFLPGQRVTPVVVER